MAEEESQTHTKTQGEIKLECPFDLETVFTMQYSTEGLKGVLTWIIEHLNDLNSGLGNLDKKTAEQIKQLKE